jgi:hypothetical protein
MENLVLQATLGRNLAIDTWVAGTSTGRLQFTGSSNLAPRV